MESIYDYLEKLEDVLDNSKAIPFSNKISVDKEELFEIISDIRLNLPGVIKQAQRLSDSCDKIINDANNKANSIIREAEDNAQRLVMESEITKLANQQASVIMEEAKQTAREMRIGAVEYADELLANVEKSIKDSLDAFNKTSKQVDEFMANELNIIYENRQELRGTSK